MDYKEFTREQLMQRIEELELLSQELLVEKEQEIRLEYAWTGNLGHWYWNVHSNAVTFNPLKVTTLGYSKEELPEHITYQFFTELLHPEDHEKTMSAMKDHLYGKASVYEVEYRIRTKEGKYRWYYDRGRITKYDENERPLFLAGIVFDITEKKQTQQELEAKNKILEEISSIDGLTKIGNHRTLMEYLKNSMISSDRTGSPLSVAIFDIDDFKKVNDSKGHVYGDQVLAGLADIIKKNIRETDLAGRYGGEEFMVVFTSADLQTAANISERIREMVENHSFGEGLHITVSGGVKQYKAEKTTELIHLADMNLYEAKKKGKNQIG